MNITNFPVPLGMKSKNGKQMATKMISKMKTMGGLANPAKSLPIKGLRMNKKN